jgi:hypothetical protein
MTSMLVAVNSLLGVRSAFATLVPIAMVLPIRPRWRNLLTGVTLGGALVFGTEQGLAAIMAFGLVTVVTVWRSTQRRVAIVDAGVALAVAMATIVCTMVAIGGVTGMKGALRFNLRMVPMDQYWYFGAPPNIFLWSWKALPSFMASQPRIPISILVAIGLAVVQLRRLWREPDGEQGRRHAALAMLAAYGVISCASLLGIYVAVYVQPCLRAVLLIGALELDAILPGRDERLGRAPVLGVSRTLVGMVVGAFIVMTIMVTSVVTALITTIPHVLVDHVVRREGPAIGGFWPATLATGQQIIDARRGPNRTPPTLWSTYAGMLEANNGIFHPSTDYIIHALGEENRDRYLSDFRRVRPRLVQTVLPAYTQYEAWIEQTSWDLYADLVRDYKVIGSTPWSIFWERDSTPGQQFVPHWISTVKGATAEIPAVPQMPNQPNVVLMEVELTYRVHNPLRWLPVVGAMPRYLVRVGNALNRYAVTLDPYRTSMRFPVLSIRGRDPQLFFNTYSLLPGASFEVTGIRVMVVPVKQENGAWLDNLLAQQTQRPAE